MRYGFEASLLRHKGVLELEEIGKKKKREVKEKKVLEIRSEFGECEGLIT